MDGTSRMTPRRVECRDRFIRLLKQEHRHSLFELGCGAGAEGLEFVRAGLHYTGADFSEESIHVARAKGLDTSVASGRSLPFADAAFPAVWTVGTLLHVPNAEIDDVVRELVRVSAAGAPIAVGLCSGDDEEVLNPDDEDVPRRFFSLRSDDTVRRIFGAHGAVELFETWPEQFETWPEGARHYQFLVLRTPT
jgi:SAM-dependent methyltransferase